MRSLELLAPAKNLECGIAAIDHGADAVYIGAQRFGARAAAGNPVADIARLCDYAHVYGAKVYVTINTILYDDEVEDTRQLLAELQQAGTDAILVQDMALLAMNSPITLHASTQTDNRTAEKVRWLRDIGFRRVVLARELSIDEVRAIHEAVPDVELEVFVHGALCVSYSGLCYASQYCFHRSANRGECAQFCRMPFDLIDADGRVIEHNRHLLSLKDMNQIDNLEQLAEAGATSFKIEGRLKDVSYVKNVTAAYSERLNQLIRRHPDKYRRASLGRCRYTFTPNLQKTFNRGYTTYFAHGRQPDIASFDTPKAIGEYVGTVKELRRDSFTVAGTASFANGDGLCYFLSNPHSPGERLRVGEQSSGMGVRGWVSLEGFRVNRAEGNRLYPQHMPQGLHPGLRLYRNSDQRQEQLLSKPSAERKIPITLSLCPTPDGYRLSAGTVSVELPIVHQTADKPQRENITRQLTKLGNTPFECTTVDIPDDFNYFIPSSQLTEMRRMLSAKLIEEATKNEGRATRISPEAAPVPPFHQEAPLYENISNHLACAFYGAERPTAFELRPTDDAKLMQCRHCLRYSLGFCVKNGGRRPVWHEPLFLRLADGRRFRLEFDCTHCQMNVVL